MKYYYPKSNNNRRTDDGSITTEVKKQSKLGGLVIFLLITAIVLALLIGILALNRNSKPQPTPLDTLDDTPVTRRVTLTAPVVEVTYGDPLPELRYTTTGGDISTEVYIDAPEGKLAAGQYTLKVKEVADSAAFDVKYVTGTLTILPKKVTIANKISKIYDGREDLEVTDLTLNGVNGGDDVTAIGGIVYFADKNVGRGKLLDVSGITLTGNDASNYVLSSDDATGEITPRLVALTGTVVENKQFDGTKKATVTEVGQLTGVLDGDVVAIGSITANFLAAKSGKSQPVKVTDVTLVGADAANYTLDEVRMLSADITENYLDIIFNRPRVIGTES
jgi:hypothetical protein